MKAGFFSPLPPAKTGVADYSSALLRELRQDVILNADGDLNLYHLGNNHLHRSIYQRALEKPGIVVIHDAVLHHFFLGALSETAYVEEFAYNYGGWSRDLARQLWAGRAHSGSDPRYFQYPMLRRITETSKAVIVHNPAAAQMVRDHAPGADIIEVPHLFEAGSQPPEYEIIRLRRELAGPELLCGVFGHLRATKRIATVVRAAQRAGLPLLVAGDFGSPELARAIDLSGAIRRTQLSEADFLLHLAAVDVCINLKYPSAGETSGIAIRAMGLGKTVILSNGPENSRYPDDACIRVDTGPAEEEMLTAYLIWLAGNPSHLEIGRRAAAHVRAEHALERVASLYRKTLGILY